MSQKRGRAAGRGVEMRRKVELKNPSFWEATNANTLKPGMVLYEKPVKMEIVEEHQNFLVVEILTKTGEKRRECINCVDLYDGKIGLVDEQGKRINPWLDSIKGKEI